MRTADYTLRHEPGGGMGCLSVGPTDYGGCVLPTVTDTGEGIRAETSPRVFERFCRVDAARSHAEGGSVTGLSIVRALVEVHGGRVGATGAARVMAPRFVIELPAAH